MSAVRQVDQTRPQDEPTPILFQANMQDAIDKLQKDLKGVPPNGVVNNGNVKRKTFKDSNGREWRIDLDNNAGTILTQ